MGAVCSVLLLAVMMPPQAAPPASAPLTARELAGYRLTEPALQRFVAASQLIAAATREDARLTADPLFTRELAVLDDVEAAAAQVEARLKFEPRFRAALRIASVSARDYTTFALALFAAHLAHGFVQSGALRRVPAGVAADNVAFVDAHREVIARVLADLGVEPPA